MRNLSTTVGSVNVNVLVVKPYFSFANFYNWGKQQGGQDIHLSVFFGKIECESTIFKNEEKRTLQNKN